jgi:hypothetical protein
MRPVHPLNESELNEHVANLDCDGYTIIRNQIAPEYLNPLRDIAQRAADDYITAWRGGMKLSSVHIGDKYGNRKFDLNPNARACFLWGDAAIELLDHDTVHAICEPALGTYHFSDLVANTQRYNPGKQYEGIHRDFRPGLTANGKHRGLWFFFLLDGYTAENGATSVIPGTHRFKADEDPGVPDSNPNHYGNRVQVIGDPGDLLVVNAACLHCAGMNQTRTPRRTLNVRVMQPEGKFHYNAWELAGPEFQAKASVRVKRFMQPPADLVAELCTDWAVMPSENEEN